MDTPHDLPTAVSSGPANAKTTFVPIRMSAPHQLTTNACSKGVKHMLVSQ